MPLHRVGITQFPQHRAGQLLAQFHAPLVEGIHVPDNPLDKDPMLVQGDERTQGAGCQALEQQGVAGPVALKHPMWRQLGDAPLLHARSPHLGSHLIQSATCHQRLGLGEEVGHEDGVMLAQGVV